MMFQRFQQILKEKRCSCIEDWELNYDEVKQKVKSGAILLDVRSLQEYNEGHLHSALHLAEYDISVKHSNIIPDKNTEIIVYCENGGRGKRAYKKLIKLGYTNVYNLCGGLDNLH